MVARAGEHLFCAFPAPDVSDFREKPKDGLTIFLDFILTKYFRERDVKEC